MSTTIELRAARAKLVSDARAVFDEAEKANREPNAEERQKFDAMLADSDKLEERFTQMERLEKAEKSVHETQGRRADANDPGATPDGEKRVVTDRRGTPEYRSAVNSYLLGGFTAMGPVEQRALQADSDVLGGALVMPTETVNALIKNVDDMVFVRQLATKYAVTSSQSLGVPTLDSNPADSDWTSELATGTEDTSMAFGRRELHPHPLAKQIKVSNKLLRLATIGAESLVRDRLAYKFAVSCEKSYLTGDGAGKPLGVYTASANGISTDRDVSTGNTTAITADSLIDAKYSLKQQYQQSPNLRWNFHRDAIKQIRKLKNSTSDYIYQVGLRSGSVDTLLDTPVIMSEYCPNTFTTGLYIGSIGDWSTYWVVDALDFSVQRLMELYAPTNQVGFIGRLETDGMPTISEAFARLKLA